jgi:hypothetical protein
MEHGSEDPAGPTNTVRVLTIMHCSDYDMLDKTRNVISLSAYNVEKRGEYGIMAQTPQAPDSPRSSLEDVK